MSLVGANYVSPDRFDQYSWLQPHRPSWAPVWYYWKEREVPARGDFVDIKTVDKMLRPLISKLNQRGIPTLPSCQGHFYNERDLREQAQWLLRERPTLRMGLLPLIDVETSVRYLYRDPSWVSPLQDELAREMIPWSGVGRMGMVVEPELAEELKAVTCDVGDVTVKGPAYSILVAGTSDFDLFDRWNHISDRILSTLSCDS